MSPPVATGKEARDQLVGAGGELWRAIDRLLDGADLRGILHHGLGPLEAARLRRLGEAVPPVLQHEERAASIALATAIPLLQRIRSSCEGPLVVLKGLEVARWYPPNGRRFGDVDLLTPRPEEVYRSLEEAGFIVDEKGLVAPQHLQPLRWPKLPLKVEIHGQVKWPARLREPDVARIIEAGSPSALGVDGLLSPAPHHHALIIAAHSWEHRPLRAVRDLLDVAVVAREADEREIEQQAAEWEFGRIWRTTRDAVERLFYGGRRTVPMRSWARHLEQVREPTVLEQHYERWLASFWALPPRKALQGTVRVLRDEVSPSPGETWRVKLARSAKATRDARRPLSEHDASISDEHQVVKPSNTE